MRITDYAAMARGTAVRERLLMGLSAGLLLCTIAEGVALARDRRAVVIVPEGLTHEARLSASRADEPYLSSLVVLPRGTPRERDSRDLGLHKGRPGAPPRA